MDLFIVSLNLRKQHCKIFVAADTRFGFPAPYAEAVNIEVPLKRDHLPRRQNLAADRAMAPRCQAGMLAGGFNRRIRNRHMDVRRRCR